MEAGDQGTAKPWKSLPEAIQPPPLPGPAVERQTSGQRRAEIEVETSGQEVKGWWGEGEPRKAPEEAGPHEEERDREEAGGRGRRSETIEPTQPAGLELWRPAGRATPRLRAGPGELRGTGEGAGVGRPSPCRSSPPPCCLAPGRPGFRPAGAAFEGRRVRFTAEPSPFPTERSRLCAS